LRICFCEQNLPPLPMSHVESLHARFCQRATTWSFRPRLLFGHPFTFSGDRCPLFRSTPLPPLLSLLHALTMFTVRWPQASHPLSALEKSTPRMLLPASRSSKMLRLATCTSQPSPGCPGFFRDHILSPPFHTRSTGWFFSSAFPKPALTNPTFSSPRFSHSCASCLLPYLHLIAGRLSASLPHLYGTVRLLLRQPAQTLTPGTVSLQNPLR